MTKTTIDTFLSYPIVNVLLIVIGILNIGDYLFAFLIKLKFGKDLTIWNFLLLIFWLSIIVKGIIGFKIKGFDSKSSRMIKMGIRISLLLFFGFLFTMGFLIDKNFYIEWFIPFIIFLIITLKGFIDLKKKGLDRIQ
tara:strand:+ start:212 stop:622 length:411 start_codon:yes stop_codon:yes gene_type:complete